MKAYPVIITFTFLTLGCSSLSSENSTVTISETAAKKNTAFNELVKDLQSGDYIGKTKGGGAAPCHLKFVVTDNKIEISAKATGHKFFRCPMDSAKQILISDQDMNLKQHETSNDFFSFDHPDWNIQGYKGGGTGKISGFGYKYNETCSVYCMITKKIK
jgi:hypothetical protein